MSAKQKITIDDYATTLIRVKARQLVGKHGFTKSDREDIEQDLTLELLVKLRRYDPARARWTTFVSTVVNRTIADLIRRRRTTSRGFHVVFHSLDENPATNRTPCADAIESGIDFAAAADFRIDLNDALAGLPADLRELAEKVSAGGISEAARRTGRSRESIRHAMRMLRRHLAACGLCNGVSNNHSVGRLRK